MVEDHEMYEEFKMWVQKILHGSLKTTKRESIKRMSMHKIPSIDRRGQQKGNIVL